MSNTAYNPNEDKPFADATNENEKMKSAGDTLKGYSKLMKRHSYFFEFKPLFQLSCVIGLAANAISLVSGAFALYLIALYFRSTALAMLTGIVGMSAIEGFYGFFMFKYFKFKFSDDHLANNLGIAALVFAIASCALNLYGSEQYFHDKDQSLSTSLLISKPKIYDLDSAKKALETSTPVFEPPISLEDLTAKHEKQSFDFRNDKANFGLGKYSETMMPDASKRLNEMLEKQNKELDLARAENAQAKKDFERSLTKQEAEIAEKLAKLQTANEAFEKQIVKQVSSENDKNRGFAYWGLIVLEFVKVACYYFCVLFMYRSSEQAVQYGTIPQPLAMWGYCKSMLGEMRGEAVIGLHNLYVNSRSKVLFDVQRIALLKQAEQKGFCKQCNKMLIAQQLTDPDAEYCSDQCEQLYYSKNPTT
jgi:hypothetical protein